MTTHTKLSTSFALALALCTLPTAAVYGQSDVKPDNTKVNQRDKQAGQATADQQKMNASDRTMTAKIRKAVIADKTLSTYGHNVKIISQNGTVTLKGPVKSADESSKIMALAVQAAGSADKVVNQMSVTQ